MKNRTYTGIIYAIIAAVLYALSSPLSKLLLKGLSPALLAALLYLGAGIGMFFVNILKKNKKQEENLTRKDFPFTALMIILDIAAPIFLMTGLSMTAAENVSLLNNFEIAATAIIALFLFKEHIGLRLWAAIILITISTMILSVKDINSFAFSKGSFFVLAACLCWGLENNCTRKLSKKNPFQIVIVKGLFSGTGALVLSLLTNTPDFNIAYISGALALGFVSYGFSIFFYVYSQRELGAAKTSAYYALSPFIGVIISLVIFGENPGYSFIAAFFIMVAGTYLAVK